MVQKKKGEETGLYADNVKAISVCNEAEKNHVNAKNSLEKQLGDKATDRGVGIKYKPERFGDQNYNIGKLKAEIKLVQNLDYQSPTEEELGQCEILITEKTLLPIPYFNIPDLNILSPADVTEALVTKKISESDKIDELVKEAVLNRWVSDGRNLHKSKRNNCAFCDNPITEERWAKLEKHFDKESEELDNDIVALMTKIETEKSTISSALSINKSLFYSKFHGKLDKLGRVLEKVVGKYSESLNVLTNQLTIRKNNILNPKSFKKPKDYSTYLRIVWNSYGELQKESDSYSNSLSKDQDRAKETLRLKEISDYLVTIGYDEQCLSIESLESQYVEANKKSVSISEDIRQKETQLTAKKRELNDEEKGAKKVNEYLNNFFGHKFLSLEAIKDENEEDNPKHIRFEVKRDSKKAYHLSEGECSLLAFCYFLAKLHDIDTKDSKPIIWIDDPISSLDGNHIFFVYSLLNAEIVASGKFEQLFISTHSLNFLKYLKKLPRTGFEPNGEKKKYKNSYFIIVRQDKISTIGVMPKYLEDYVTEFNYLFEQIYKCATITTIDDNSYTTFYNFANNARKFFEIYLYYKYPDQGMTGNTLSFFFGEGIPTILINRINNEYSHLSGVFERGAMPVEVPEMQISARRIIEKLKEKDQEQYLALLKSIGESEQSLEEIDAT